MKPVVEGRRRWLNDGDGDGLAGAWEKIRKEHAPETSHGCPGAYARAVEAAVVVNSGHR